MKRILTVILLCLISVPIARAGDCGPQSDRNPVHELSLGVGDQLFENLVWQNPQFIVDNMGDDWSSVYRERYRYSQHWFFDYYYNMSERLALGVRADFSACLWDEVLRSGSGSEISREADCFFMNISLLPKARWSWYHSPALLVYSALGIGLNINTGTEADAYGKKTACGLAADLTLAGVQYSFSHWYAFGELGGLTSLKDKNTIYMLGSRIISLGVGLKF